MKLVEYYNQGIHLIMKVIKEYDDCYDVEIYNIIRGMDYHKIGEKYTRIKKDLFTKSMNRNGANT